MPLLLIDPRENPTLSAGSVIVPSFAEQRACVGPVHEVYEAARDGGAPISRLVAAYFLHVGIPVGHKGVLGHLAFSFQARQQRYRAAVFKAAPKRDRKPSVGCQKSHKMEGR